MFRRATAVFLGTSLLAVSAGCRLPCCNGPGWFSSNSQGAPCHLTSGATGGCFDPISGRPIPCPPGDSTILIPGGTAPPGVAPRPDELPFPSPGDMIRPPGVPFAPPTPAPGMGTSTTPKDDNKVKGTTTKQ
jgi:hypothetical protein